MINPELSIISEIASHYISPHSNYIQNNATSLLPEDELEGDFFRKLLLKPFAQVATTYQFCHSQGLEFNVLRSLSLAIKESPDLLLEKSKAIASHLLEASSHHAIKSGEVLVAYFNQVGYAKEYYPAIGIYKFEDKDLFLDPQVSGTSFDVSLRQGLGSQRPEKAVLIVFAENEPIVLSVEKGSGSAEYWTDDFIGMEPQKDFVYQTNSFLTLAKTFITKEMPEVFDVNKTDQLELLDKSINYFKSNNTFSKDEFEEEVFGDPVLRAKFQDFDQQYSHTHGLELENSFEIANQAVKKQNRIFKSVLKLDKNFHVYIHGDRSKIEQGTDPDGRKFYKIYYDKED
jgi:hypothetical protein